MKSRHATAATGMPPPQPNAKRRSGRVDVNGVAKGFGSVAAVDDVSLTVDAGEFVTILGPSGSGKTTLLKLIAGFEMPDGGGISIDGDDITLLDPAARDIGMVFQNYALFPHMTVAKNIAYPLIMRRRPKAEIAERVAEALALVELPEYGARKPNQLSGGQQQRVALARAVVFRPRLLLLDEPFGALDRKLREQMQFEVRRLQQHLGLTTIFITHDQEEALVMSDRIAVMDKGHFQQIGTPQEIYEAPANPFVANFIGESNLLAGKLEGVGDDIRLRLNEGPLLTIGPSANILGARGRTVRVMIRPERFAEVPADGVATNLLTGTVLESAYTGGADRYRLRCAGGFELLVRLPAGPGRRRYGLGETLAVAFEPSDARLVEVS